MNYAPFAILTADHPRLRCIPVPRHFIFVRIMLRLHYRVPALSQRQPSVVLVLVQD